MKRKTWLIPALICAAMVCALDGKAPAQGGGGLGEQSAVREESGPQPGAVAVVMSEREKVSYCIGLDIGTNLKRQSVDVDVDMMARGIEDILEGNEPLFSQEEVKAIMLAFQREYAAKREAEMRELAAKNLEESEEFLAQNRGKVGVLTTESGLQYMIITEGTGPKPTAEDVVKVHYRGTLIDGTEFDSSIKRGQPAVFPVGGVIAGWTEALQMMPVGSKYRLFVPPALGYGERGAGQVIEPNDLLIFEVELLSIEEAETGQE